LKFFKNSFSLNFKQHLVKINIKYLLPYPYQNGDIREESKLDKNIDVTVK